MKVVRRAFMRVAMAIASAVSLPASSVQARQEPWYVTQLRTTGRLEDCTVVLDEPFVIDDSYRDTVIRNVTLVASDTLADDEVLLVFAANVGWCDIAYCMHLEQPRHRSVAITEIWFDP